QARKLAFVLGLGSELVNPAVKIFLSLCRAFEATDASLVEVNPFAITADSKLLALDAKMNFDDNALFRHKELLELRDYNEEDPLEIQAARHGINYILLERKIACIINGLRLAMAKMNSIKMDGGY